MSIVLLHTVGSPRLLQFSNELVKYLEETVKCWHVTGQYSLKFRETLRR